MEKLKNVAIEYQTIHLLYVDTQGFPQVAPMYCTYCSYLDKLIVCCRPDSKKAVCLKENSKSTWYFGPIEKFNRLYAVGNIKMLTYAENSDAFKTQWLEVDSKTYKNFDATHLMLYLDVEEIIEHVSNTRNCLWKAGEGQ